MPALSNNLELHRCPHCRIDNPNLFQVHNLETYNSQGQDRKFWMVYQCKRCGRLVTAASFSGYGREVIEYYPKFDSIDENIPSPARDYLVQAADSIHSAAGSVMLSASAIDSMLKVKGYEQGSLYERINKASEDHLITKEMATWAHKVRLDANDQRHADINAGLPSPKDAEHSLEFAKALAQFLFVLPSRIAKGIEETN